MYAKVALYPRPTVSPITRYLPTLFPDRIRKTSLSPDWASCPTERSLLSRHLLPTSPKSRESPETISPQPYTLTHPVPRYSADISSSRSMPTADTVTVCHTVTKSNVLEKLSASPNGIMEAMFPRAYSRAHAASGILYCFAVPLGRKCWSPGPYTSRSSAPAGNAHCSPCRMVK